MGRRLIENPVKATRHGRRSEWLRRMGWLRLSGPISRDDHDLIADLIRADSREIDGSKALFVIRLILKMIRENPELIQLFQLYRSAAISAPEAALTEYERKRRRKTWTVRR